MNAQASILQVGYTPFHLFDVDLGIPVFRPNEEVWIYTQISVGVILYSPSSKLVAKSDVLKTPVLLYKFSDKDEEGVWTLLVMEKYGQPISIPLIFVKKTLKPKKFDYNLTFEGNYLVVKGKAYLDSKSKFKSKVFLIKKREGTKITVINTNITIARSNLFLYLSFDEKRNKIEIAPYVIPISKVFMPRKVVVWAEITQEVPLVKISKKGGTIILFLEEPIVRTSKVRMVLERTMNQSLVINLPKESEVGLGGSIPLRPGKATLKIYFDEEKLIHVYKHELYLFPSKERVDIVSKQEIKPLTNPLTFALKDFVRGSNEYMVLLLVKKYGVNTIWNKSIIPKFAKIIVKNKILNKNVTEYELNFFDKNISYTKIGDITYVLFNKKEVSVRYNLTYKGVKLDEFEREPRLLTLRQGEESVIKVKAGYVAILAKYEDGELIDGGFADIFRLNKKEEFVGSWSWRDKILNLTLPYGKYKVKITVGEKEQNKTVSVSKPNNIVSFKFLRSEVVTGRDEMSKFLFGLAVFVLMIEAVIAFKVWRRALRKG